MTGKRRMRWEDMDQLKARMLREGYPLPGISQEGNEAIWYSLAKGIRRPHLQALVGMDADQIEHAVRDVRGMRQLATRRR